MEEPRADPVFRRQAATAALALLLSFPPCHLSHRLSSLLLSAGSVQTKRGLQSNRFPRRHFNRVKRTQMQLGHRIRTKKAGEGGEEWKEAGGRTEIRRSLGLGLTMNGQMTDQDTDPVCQSGRVPTSSIDQPRSRTCRYSSGFWAARSVYSFKWVNVFPFPEITTASSR